MGVAMADPMTPPVAAAAFLDAAGWGGAEVLPLAGDASFRRYFRVRTGHAPRRADGRARRRTRMSARSSPSRGT